MYPCVPIDRYLAYQALESGPAALGLIFHASPTEENYEEILIIKELATFTPLIALLSYPFPEILSSLTQLACFGIEGIHIDGLSTEWRQIIHSYIAQHRLGLNILAE